MAPKPKRIDLTGFQTQAEWDVGAEIREAFKDLGPEFFSSSEDEAGAGDSQVPKDKFKAMGKGRGGMGWYRVELAHEKGTGKGASSGEPVASASSGEPVASAEQRSSQATAEEYSAMSDDNHLKRKAQTQ
jgi:hypothetical protein